MSQIKTPTKFETFNDGIVSIYSVKANKIDTKQLTLNFGDRVVGIKRYYAAKTAGMEINRVIQVPMNKGITADERATIKEDCYKIEQVQHINDTNPPITVLTLRIIDAVR